MSAGTITLTNNSTAVTGSGTAFTTDLKAGDFITATVGGILYTLTTETINSNTSVTLSSAYTGPTQAGAAWVAVPRKTANQLTADLVTQATQAIRGLNNDKQNWQQFYSAPGDMTVTLPDGTTVTGPSWPKMSSAVSAALTLRGELPSTANLNTYGPSVSGNVGLWSKTLNIANGSITNGFPEDNCLGVFEVFNAGPYYGTQRFTNRNGNIYTRSLTNTWNGTDGPWSPWAFVGDNTRPIVYSGDMNALLTPGKWSTSNTVTNAPTIGASTTVNNGLCEVILRNASNTVLQRFTNMTSGTATYNFTWQRTLYGTTWSPWELLGTKALNDLGLGLTAVQTLSSFDWQQADLLSGAIYYVSSTNITNMPAGVTYTAGTGLYILVRGNAQSGVRNSIQIIPDSIPNSNYREYEILIVGAKGSRSFTVRQLFTSADIIPLTSGGTGATTAAAARTALALGTAATRNTGITSGTVPLVSSMFNMGLKGGHVEFSSADAWYSMMKQYGLMTFRPSSAINAPYNFIAASPTLWCNTAETYFLMNVPHTGNGPIHIMAGYADTGFGVDRLLWDNVNTTVDASGYIKKASPVIKLFDDGRSEVNAEAEGCVVTRTARGEYLIEGCMGLHSDAAWGGTDGGFDIPVDINKQPKIWLDYLVNADGSIVVKTYHREHASAPKFARNIIEGVADGEPIDIPADQFVSVRVEMPIDSIWSKKQEKARVESEEVASKYRMEEARRMAEEERPDDQDSVQNGESE